MSNDPKLTDMQFDLVRDLMDDPPTQSEMPSDPWPEPPTTPVPINLATEQQAFADLLSILSASDDGDHETVISTLSEGEFAEEMFEPELPTEPDLTENQS